MAPAAGGCRDLDVVLCSTMLEFGLGLLSSIDEVVVMMAHGNKVCSASPYLVNISDDGELPVREGTDSWCRPKEVVR